MSVRLREGAEVMVGVDVNLEHGVLKAGQLGRVFSAETDDGVCGFQWTDRRGTHAMALDAVALAPVPFDLTRFRASIERADLRPALRLCLLALCDVAAAADAVLKSETNVGTVADLDALDDLKRAAAWFEVTAP